MCCDPLCACSLKECGSAGPSPCRLLRNRFSRGGPDVADAPDRTNEAIRIANEVRYGLSGSIWTGNLERGTRLLAAMGTDQGKAILDLARRGTAISTVARITNLSRPTVYRVLQNQNRRSA